MSKDKKEEKKPDPPPAPTMPNYMKFVLGGSSGMAATCVVHPFDLMKTRMQISGSGGGKKEYKNSLDCLQSVIKLEGFSGLYKGLGASILRQATYTTARLGVYTYLNEQFVQARGKEPPLLFRMGMGIMAGAAGAFVGNPAEVALIRMQADGRLPKEQRRNYKNVANALIRMVKEEGFGVLFRGCVPTVVRAMIVNMAQLATYSQAKSMITKAYHMKDGIQLHFFSAMLSGFLTTIVSMPVDIIKTRVQNMKYIDGKPEYTGALDCLGKLTKQEGVLALWKGFTPYYARLGPHTVLIFVFLEQFNKLYFKYVLGTTGGSGI